MCFIYYSLVMWLILRTLFFYGMDECVSVKTYDKEILLKKSDIHQSLVLDVLYAHQKKTTPNLINIPKALKEHDQIHAKDVLLLNKLLEQDNEQCEEYIKNLSYYEQQDYARALYVLGAQKHFMYVINNFFSEDVKHCIGSQMITQDVQDYIIKKIIHQRTSFAVQEINEDECWINSSANGSSFYIPFELLSYKKNVFFDGINPFIIEFFFKNKGNVSLKALSYYKNYSVVEKGEDLNKQTFMCNINNDVFWDIASPHKHFSNKGKVECIVFNKDETCVVVGSKSDKKNLFCWVPHTPHPHFDGIKGYKMSGHKGAIGKIIVSDDGIYIVSSSKDKISVIVWDLKHEICYSLYDKEGSWVRAMAFSNNDTLLWICVGAVIHVWKKNNGISFDKIHTINLEDKTTLIGKILILEKIRRIVIGKTDGMIEVINMNTYQHIHSLCDHKQSINILIANDQENIVVSSTDGDDNNLIVWDIREGSPLTYLIGHPGIKAILMTSDARYIVSQSEQNILLWHMYDELEGNSLCFIKNNLPFLSYYYLYCLYKREKNGFKDNKLYKIALLASLKNVQGIDKFIEDYLL